MISLTYIPNHADEAEARLPTQYIGKPKLAALVRIPGSQAQSLEDVAFDLLSHSSILNARYGMLDQIGDIVGQPRNAMGDNTYRGYIISKIAQNISTGTPEVLIGLYKFLMQAEKVYYRPLYPASMTLTAIGSLPLGTIPEIAFSFSDDPDPQGQGFGDFNNADTGGELASGDGFSVEALTIIKAALNSARIAGVSIDYFATVQSTSFSFSEDPDLNGAGFGDSGDSSVGGVLAEII